MTDCLPRRCYACDQAEALYEAHLDHDTTPVVLLCEVSCGYVTGGRPPMADCAAPRHDAQDEPA